jgi:hypothetical protein
MRNKLKYEILKTATGLTYNLPIYLECSVDEMGVMVGFDGDITPVELFCDFSYTQTGNTLTVYNTIHIEKFKRYYEATFTINWGDNSTSGITIHSGTTLSSVSKTYSSTGQYDVSISLDSPWTKQKLTKKITVPQNTTVTNPLGTFSGFTIPYTTITGSSIDYLSDLDYTTGNTGYTTFTYVSIGGSRIIEKKLYGSSSYTGVTTGSTAGLTYSGYTIEGLYYRDYSDGYTMITGTTSGYTKEEVFNSVITRNEHFLGFIDEPTIYSDVFVERGKLGVMENNLRLGEIDNMQELEIYGNGFFNVKKQ